VQGALQSDVSLGPAALEGLRRERKSAQMEKNAPHRLATSLLVVAFVALALPLASSSQQLASGRPQNLPVPKTLKSQLRAVFAAKHFWLGKAEIQGPRKGSVRYGRYRGREYAIADLKTVIDGIYVTEVFSRAVGGRWSYRGNYDKNQYVCSDKVPSALLRLWKKVWDLEDAGTLRLNNDPRQRVYWCVANHRDRLHSWRDFKLNLDGDRALERVRVYVQVYNVDQGDESMPTTYFEVGDSRNGSFVSAQLERVFQSPVKAGWLMQAWVRDLNGDGRAEIAVRNYSTPSVGETLTIYRQKKARSLRFAKLQTLVGDQVVIAKSTAPVRWKTLIKANHAPDSIEHHELWSWAPTQKKWACKTDCVPR
jgi:hypothetical protein